MENVLVVDGDPYTLKLFERLFRERTRKQLIDITLISSGSEAKRLFLGQTYDLILMDRNLSDGNGLDLLLWMTLERPRQLAVLMSDFADDKAAVEAVSKGLFAVLSKPFSSLEKLEAVIEKGLELNRAYREIDRLRDTLETRNTRPQEEGKISSYRQEMALFESSYLKRLLKATNGDIVEAARFSGISPEDLSLLLKRRGLS